MKKKLLIVAMLVVVIMTAVLLAGCSGDKMQLGFMESAEGTAEYLKVNIKDYEGKTLADLLKGEESLGAKFNEYGLLSEVNGLVPTDTQYICIFTTDESKKSVYEGAPAPIEKDGVTYYESGFGVNDLVVSKEIKYLFIIITWA